MPSEHKLRDKLRSLVKELEDEDESVRGNAIVRLRELGRQAKPASLAVIARLADEAESVRFQAYQFLVECYPTVRQHPSVLGGLSSEDREVRLAAIREVITILPEVRDAITARRPGWSTLDRLREQGGVDQAPRVRPLRDEPTAPPGQPESVTEDSMEKANKSTTRTVAGAEETVRHEGEELATRAHLIRIADQETRRRAITALGKAREPYCGFTDYRLLVTDEHLEVLKREAIPFEVVS